MPRLDRQCVSRYRRLRGLSQRKLAFELGYKRSKIEWWERRNTKVTWEAADALARALKVPVNYLLKFKTEFNGEKLRELRTARGLRRKGLAAAIQCNRHSVQHWELGKHKPHKIFIEALAKFFNVPVEELTG